MAAAVALHPPLALLHVYTDYLRLAPPAALGWCVALATGSVGTANALAHPLVRKCRLIPVSRTARRPPAWWRPGLVAPQARFCWQRSAAGAA